MFFLKIMFPVLPPFFDKILLKIIKRHDICCFLRNFATQKSIIMKGKYIIWSFLFAIMLSSCVVSKKKYDTLSRAKFASDRKVRTLLKEKRQLKEELSETISANNRTILSLKNKLSDLKSEFNNLKYDMSASNAQKSSEIDRLSKKLNSSIKAKENIKEKSQELEGDLNWLRKERQANTEKIDMLTTKVAELKREVNTLRSKEKQATTSNATYLQQIEDLKSKVNALEELIRREKATNLKLQKALSNKPKTPKKAKQQPDPIPEI